MGEDDRRVSLADSEEYEKKEQGYTGDDIRIDHRKVVQEGHRLAPAALEIIDTNGSHSPEESGHKGGGHRNDYRIDKGGIKRSATFELT